jgi:hypothetical protein
MTRTGMVLKTLAYSFFNRLLWLLTQDSSTDISNISVNHSCCHLEDTSSLYCLKIYKGVVSDDAATTEARKKLLHAVVHCLAFVTFTEL